ncbi:MAG TPA: flagellar FliJ family protein [Azospirillaceae bacterium]|nr:flagellar FliJ family protein [Azospirillaceae bacterium]
MKGLKTLIRLHKSEVDERRRRLTELQSMAEGLEEERRRFEEQVLEEQRVASLSLETSLTYAAFARQVIDRREQYAAAKREVERRIALAEAAVTEAFQELKRFELAEEDRVRREQARLKHAEALMLDEVASQRFQRNQAEE